MVLRSDHSLVLRPHETRIHPLRLASEIPWEMEFSFGRTSFDQARLNSRPLFCSGHCSRDPGSRPKKLIKWKG